MNKFYALVISSDLTLNRMWLDNNMAVSMLKEQQNIKIYRQMHDQEAILTENDIVWKDVPTIDYKVKTNE